MVLKRVLAKKISHFDGQIGQKMPETCDEIFLDPQNPFFCIKDKKNLLIQNVGHIWAYIHANSQDFWKSFNGFDKTKRVKKCGKKMQKTNFF